MDTASSTGFCFTVLSTVQYYKTDPSTLLRMVTRSSFATARRTELFDGLVELFLAEGFAHLTLDAIAARLQCSKSTLYTLAGSKEQLVTSATKHFFKRATEQVEAKVAAASSAERIAAYLTAVGKALTTASAQFMSDLDAFAPRPGGVRAEHPHRGPPRAGTHHRRRRPGRLPRGARDLRR